MNRARRSGRYPQAFIPFFTAAILFGAAAVPLWVLIYNGSLDGCAGCDPFARHAHEMLFGYALAVVGGFLFTKVDKPALMLCLALWLAGRAAVLADLPPTIWTAALSIGYPVCVFLFAGLPFMKAARSAHNAVFGPVLGAFTAAELVYQLGSLGFLDQGERRGVFLAFDLVALLMFVMGGRVIPAATAGAIREKGGYLRIRVQPRVEWLGIGALATIVGLDLFMAPPAVSGVLSAVAGVAALVRLSRWDPWRILDRPDMWSLHLGYVWLGIGLLLMGVSRGLDVMPVADAVHATTIGALGTLSLSMMARTAMQRSGLPTTFSPPLTAAVAAMSIGTVVRLLAPLADRQAMVALSGALWSASLLLFLGGLVPLFRHARRRRAAA